MREYGLGEISLLSHKALVDQKLWFTVEISLTYGVGQLAMVGKGYLTLFLNGGVTST